VKYIRNEYRDAKAKHKQSKKRLRALRSFTTSHYTLLALATFDVLLALFAVAETDAPWKGEMLIITGACFFLGAFILLSSIEK